MTLAEAKKIIKSECYIADLLDLDRTHMVNTALDTVIEAAEETRWIPLNAEGNEPKEEGFYLLCLDDGYVTTVYYDGKDWELWLDSGEPIAYMPLPTPYKAEGSDEE